MEKLTISVTQKHIDAGKPGNCSFCPAAVATTEATGKAVRVGRRAVSIFDSSSIYPYLRYKTPENLKQFILDFDAGRLVEPFAFVLEEGC